MKKIDLGQGIGLLANIGVVVGIVFLATEIRQNTQSLEINAYQDLISQISQVGTLAAEAPEQFSNSYQLLRSTPEELPQDERLRTASFVMNFVRHGDLAYLQFERGVISEERLRSATAILDTVICTPFFQTFWPNARRNLVQSYGEYLAARVNAC